jgi:hypothetical protein
MAGVKLAADREMRHLERERQRVSHHEQSILPAARVPGRSLQQAGSYYLKLLSIVGSARRDAQDLFKPGSRSCAG